AGGEAPVVGVGDLDYLAVLHDPSRHLPDLRDGEALAVGGGDAHDYVALVEGVGVVGEPLGGEQLVGQRRLVEGLVPRGGLQRLEVGDLVASQAVLGGDRADHF